MSWGGDKCQAVTDDGAYDFRSAKEFLKLMNRLYRAYDPYIRWLATMPLTPLSRRFGQGRGTPIDRWYIDAVLDAHRDVIHGDVYEVAESTYTHRYATGAYVPHAIHVGGIRGMEKVDLATGEGVREAMADCFICTQTLQFIYDVQSAAKNIYKMLKSGGTVILSANGINPLSLSDYHAWGEYWNFTAQSLRRLLQDAGFAADQIEIRSHGNIKIAVCYLYGLCQEDLQESDFLYEDEQFPMLLTAVCKK